MAARRAKKSKTKAKANRRTVANVRRTKIAKRSAKAKTAKRTKAKTPVRKAKAKKTRATRKEVYGEGNYAATREFDKEQTAFVKKNYKRIPRMGKEAEAALEGPEGNDLRRAEEEAKSHSHAHSAGE
jgi:hypothetical protein